jgi:F1F0 ATPase subunit 2
MTAAPLFFAAASGIVLGAVFYTGLWLTVRSIAVARHPLALTMGSLLFRFALALAGLLVVLNAEWQNAAAYLAGFIAARFAVSRVVALCI